MPNWWMAISASNATIDVTFPSEESAFMTVMYGAENLVIILDFKLTSFHKDIHLL